MNLGTSADLAEIWVKQGVKAGARLLAAAEAKSSYIPRFLARKMDRIATIWAATFLLAALPAVAFSVTPAQSLGEFASLALPYLCIAMAPVAGLHLTLRAFPNGLMTARPAFHLSFYGRWTRVDPIRAIDSPGFGPSGFMASLLVGLLLNVVVRAGEFLVAVPAVASSGPIWGQTLFHIMAADVAVMGFFYMVCFAMALRSVPYFPKMLLLVWGLDILAQLLIAHRMSAIAELPHSVALPLQQLLQGNITKVLISAAVWLPYLMLSDRVNITYRQRIRALPA
ncbi:MAG: hypothetical protein RL299_282 [Pseudomonadota bacterium]|jgi:hypothetical protein